LIDIVPTAESITSVQAHITGIFTEFDFMQSLEDDERKRLQRLGFRNETFSLGIIEIARQNPTLIPSRINLAQIGRDVDAREALLPVLLQLQALTRMLEDTHILLGVDIYKGALALYKVLQVVGDLEGLNELIAYYGQRFKKRNRTDGGTPPPAASGTGETQPQP
jgi:hypothetical protein